MDARTKALNLVVIYGYVFAETYDSERRQIAKTGQDMTFWSEVHTAVETGVWITRRKSTVKCEICGVEMKVDLDDVPDTVRESLDFILVDTVDEVLDAALGIQVDASVNGTEPVVAVGQKTPNDG